MTVAHSAHPAISALRVASLLSTVLLFGVVLMWGRSYWVMDRYSFATDDGTTSFKLRSETGRLSYMRLVERGRMVPKEALFHSIAVLSEVPLQTLLSESNRFAYEVIGLGEPKFGGFSKTMIVAPYWTAALACCVLPMVHSRLRRIQHRRAVRVGGARVVDVGSAGPVF